MAEAHLSLPRFATYGAMGGLLLTLFPFALEALGLASREGSTIGTWQIIAVITGPFVLLSAASASVTLLIARIAEGRASREASEDVADVGLGDGEAPPLLGGGSSSLLGHAARPGERARPVPAKGRRDA